MVQPSADVAFAPAVKAVVAVSADGTLAAVHEPARIVVIALPRCALITEVGIDPEAAASEALWVGTPPRLLVMSRYSAHSTLHLLDPHGPRTLAEIRLEAPMRLVSSVGAHALAIGQLGAAVLTAGDAHLTPYQFPARAVPTAAGAAGAQFMVALAGSIEEWDPASRMPKRRLRLPRPAVIKAVGGSERIVWMTTQGDPTRIDCLPLVNRGQPKGHDLPEPIASIAAHPRSDLIACIGADSGKVYLIDLDGRQRMRTLGVDGVDRADAAALVVARGTSSLVVIQARRAVAMVALGGGEVETVGTAAPAQRPSEPSLRKSSLGDDDEPVRAVERTSDPVLPAAALPVRKSIAIDAPAPSYPPSAFSSAPASRSASGPASGSASASASIPASSALTAPAPVQMSALPRGRAPIISTEAPSQSLTERFSAWRDRMRESRPRGDGGPATVAWMDSGPSWRDELAAWSRGVISGSLERGEPSSPLLEQMLARFDLPASLAPALALLYGAHLCGEPGVAPIDLARVLSRHWDEALGRGQLAARGVAVYEQSRVRLAPGVLRALDERPPRTGVLVGESIGPVALLGPCVVVAPSGPIGLLAETYLPNVGGAILAADPGADPAELFIEARAYGAVPLLLAVAGQTGALPADPAILVVSDDDAAIALGIPRL